MAIIAVPKPSKKAMNPGRAVNCLLLAQVEHLQHAERRLPMKYRSEIYTRAIRTEGEAANYIRQATEAIHQAHADAAAARDKRALGRNGGPKSIKGRAKAKKHGRRKIN